MGCMIPAVTFTCDATFTLQDPRQLPNGPYMVNTDAIGMKQKLFLPNTQQYFTGQEIHQVVAAFLAHQCQVLRNTEMQVVSYSFKGGAFMPQNQYYIGEGDILSFVVEKKAKL